MKDGQLPPEEVGQFLISILGIKNADWWFRIYLTGMDRNATPATFELEIILEKVGFLEAGEAMKQKDDLGQFHQGWEMNGGGELPDIFRRIETVDSF